MKIELSEETTRKLVIDILTKDAEILVTVIQREMVEYYGHTSSHTLDNLISEMRHLDDINKVIVYYGGKPVELTP